MSKSNHCISCGSNLQGEYCARCGERKLEPELRKFSNLVGDLVESVTSLDGKLFKSLANLIFKPGINEYNFHRGSRVKFMRPIALFLFVNVIFVTLMPLSDFFVSFGSQHRQLYSPYILNWIENFVLASGLSPLEFETQYNQLVKILARSIIIISVPFLLPFVILVFRDKEYFVSDHFVFSLNVYAWLMLWMLVSWWFCVFTAFIFEVLFSFEFSPFVLYSPLMLLGVLVYLLMAIKRMYRQSWLMSLLKMPVILLGVAVSHMMFRLIQLGLTMWAV